MYGILVKFTVKDYGVWRKLFDAAAGPRETSGLRTTAVISSVDDPSKVMVVFQTADLAKAKAHLSDPETRKGQASSGFLAPPEIFFGELK